MSLGRIGARPKARSHPQNSHTARRRRQEAKDCKNGGPRCRTGMLPFPAPSSLRGAKRRSNPVRPHGSRQPPWIASLALAMTNSIGLALRFFWRPELCQRCHETGLPKGEAERRKARSQRPRRAQAERRLVCASRRAPLLAVALAFRRSTAALAKFSRLGSVRSRASWQRQRIKTSVRHPGSQLLADRRRGRPGEFPNRPRMELRAPSRAPPPPASIGRHRLTPLSTSRMGSFSSSHGAVSRNYGGVRQRIDSTNNRLALFV